MGKMTKGFFAKNPLGFRDFSGILKQGRILALLGYFDPKF
jgi:hypothetical protein